MGKDRGFCPFLSSERSDGNINKVECSKKCALFTFDGCALVIGPGPVGAGISSIGIKLGEIKTSLDKISERLSISE